MLGFYVGNSVVQNFMAYYLQKACNVGVGEAGVIVSLSVASAFIVGPIAGRIFDRFENAKRLVLMAGIVLAVGVGIAFIGALHSAIVSIVLVGSASGAGFIFGFAAAREANKLGSEYDTLAVSWVNGFQLFSSFVSPLLFSYLAISFGYGYAWLGIALLAFLLFLPVFFSKIPARRMQQYSRVHNETI